MINNNNKELIKLIDKLVFKTADRNFFIKVQSKLTLEGQFEFNEFKNFQIYPKKLEILTPEELYLFAKAIEQISPKLIRVSDYFTEYELKEFKTYTRNAIDIISIRKLKNVFKLDDNQWSCVASVEQIALMSKYNVIRTNPNFQRQSKATGVTIDTNEIMRKIYINYQRADEIEKLLIENNYNFNTIRINLIDDGECKPKFTKDNEVIIPENGDIIVLDGNHRRQACEQAYFNHPELKERFKNQYFQVIFTFYKPRKVKQTISQEWNVEKVNTKHLLAMKESFSNDVVDAIKRSHKTEPIIANGIVTTGLEIATGNGYIVYSTLSDSIDQYYKLNQFKLKSQVLDLADWLIEFYNYLSVLLVDDFSNIKKSNKLKWSTNNYTTFGFVYLSSILRNKSNWKELLRQIITNIDWSVISSPINKSKTTANIVLVENFFERVV